MKKNRFKVMGILLLFCLLLSGCSGNWKDYFYTEESLKQEAQRALEEKYDEEFVIHDVWVVAQSAFGAMCSPKNDMDVVFEVELYKDGSEMYRDEYVQGIVSKKMSERLYDKLKPFFGDDCYVKAHLYGLPPSIEKLMENYKGEEPPSLEYFKNLTVEEYYKLDEDPRLGLWIIVNKETLSNNKAQIKAEYECLSSLVDNEPMQNAGCSCHFLDKDRLDECKNYFYKMNKGDTGGFDSIVEEEAQFGFGYNDGIINKSFEDYNEIRKETGINE